MTAILPLILRAVLAGIGQILLDWQRRRRERQSVLKAIAGEVGVICQIVQHQYSAERFRELARYFEETGIVKRLSLDLKCNFFTMYEAFAPKLGELSGVEAGTISQFYNFCKIVLETVRDESVYSRNPYNYWFIASTIEKILVLGDRIMCFPSTPLKLDPLASAAV